jgi:hypothetical protein
VLQKVKGCVTEGSLQDERSANAVNLRRERECRPAFGVTDGASHSWHGSAEEGGSCVAKAPYVYEASCRNTGCRQPAKSCPNLICNIMAGDMEPL